MAQSARADIEVNVKGLKQVQELLASLDKVSARVNNLNKTGTGSKDKANKAEKQAEKIQERKRALLVKNRNIGDQIQRGVEKGLKVEKASSALKRADLAVRRGEFTLAKAHQQVAIKELGIERQITQKFSGASNAGKFVLTFTEDGQEKPEIVPIQVSNADKQYTVLNELCIQNIMIGHRVTSPMLLGVKTEGQLGGRNELIQAYEMYMNTVVKPYQNIILRTFKRLLAVNDIVIPFHIQNVSPINSLFGSDVLKDVLTQDEIREQAGFDALEQDEQSVTEEVELKKKTLLDKLINEYGEDEDLDNWDLLDADSAEDEHEDFDFEYNLEKLELATTGRAYKNAPSSQDGQSQQEHKTKYRVRYAYVRGRGFAVDKGGESREFCSKMMAARKIYRKEDIIRMGTQGVNPGWGLNGADTYSIWKFKGGGDCRHLWERRIYAQKGDKPSDFDKLITTTKARSEGFRPQINEQEVPVAPKNMRNRGYVNKIMR